MNIDEPITMMGCLTIESLDTSGIRKTLVDDKNLIVLSGRNAIVEALAGTLSSNSCAIVDIAFGDDGVLPTNSSIAKQVFPEDFEVNREIFPDVVKGVDYSFAIQTLSTQSTPKVVVSVTVPKVPIGFSGTDSESLTAGLNGKNISELALMMASGKAFSIKRFPAIPKSPEISIIITWKIYA